MPLPAPPLYSPIRSRKKTGNESSQSVISPRGTSFGSLPPPPSLRPLPRIGVRDGVGSPRAQPQAGEGEDKARGEIVALQQRRKEEEEERMRHEQVALQQRRKEEEEERMRQEQVALQQHRKEEEEERMRRQQQEQDALRKQQEVEHSERERKLEHQRKLQEKIAEQKRQEEEQARLAAVAAIEGDDYNEDENNVPAPPPLVPPFTPITTHFSVKKAKTSPKANPVPFQPPTAVHVNKHQSLAPVTTSLPDNTPFFTNTKPQTGTERAEEILFHSSKKTTKVPSPKISPLNAQGQPPSPHNLDDSNHSDTTDKTAEVVDYSITNASLNFVSKYFPESVKCRMESKIPLSFSLQPLATCPADPSHIPPLVKSTKLPVSLIKRSYSRVNKPNPFIRCSTDECRSFMNVHSEFDSDGHSWRCAYCGVFNDLPYSFRAHNERASRGRLDLSNTTMEYDVGDNFCTRDPALCKFGGATLLLLDTSISARQSNQLAVTAKQLVDSIFNDDTLSLSSGKNYILVTFDYDTINLYSFKGKHYKIVTISDLTDLFISFSLEEMVVSIQPDVITPISPTNQFKECLLSLPKMFPKDENVKMSDIGTDRTTAFGPALLVANHIISSLGCGSIVSTLSARPGGKRVLGNCGAIRNREIDIHKNLNGCLFRPERVKVDFAKKGEFEEEKKSSDKSSNKSSDKSGDDANGQKKGVIFPSFYQNIAQQLKFNSITTHLIISTGTYMDIPALGNICETTQGCLHKFNYLSSSNHGERTRYMSILEDIIEGPFRKPDKYAYDVTTRVRISKGLVVHQINSGALNNADSIGLVPNTGENLFRSASDDVNRKRVGRALALEKTCFVVPSITSDTVFDIDVEFDSNLENYDSLRDGLGGCVSIQTTTVYTTFYGERRLRIHNLDLETTRNSQKVAMSVDAECLSLLLTRKAIRSCRKSGTESARQEVHKFCQEFFQFMSRTNDEEENRLCDTILRICMGLEKCGAFCGVRSGGKGTGVDTIYNIEEKNLMMHKLTLARPMQTLEYCVPSLVMLGGEVENSNNKLALKIGSLRSDKAYALLNCEGLTVWIGSDKGGQGGSSLAKNLSEEESNHLRSIIKRCRLFSNPKPSLSSVKSIRSGGDDKISEAEFLGKLYDDRSNFNGGTFNFDEYKSSMILKHQPPAQNYAMQQHGDLRGNMAHYGTNFGTTQYVSSRPPPTMKM